MLAINRDLVASGDRKSFHCLTILVATDDATDEDRQAVVGPLQGS